MVLYRFFSLVLLFCVNTQILPHTKPLQSFAPYRTVAYKPVDLSALTLAPIANFTQSQAFIQIPQLDTHAQEHFMVDKARALASATKKPLENTAARAQLFADIMRTAIKNEEKYQDKYIFAYHAHAGLLQAFQDIYYKMAEHMHQRPGLPSFIFFRNPQERIGPLSDLKKLGTWTDHASKLRNALLSASVTCTDSTKWESALFFYAKDSSILLGAQQSSNLNKLFDKLHQAGLQTKTIENIRNTYKAAPASFIQLFLPRKHENLFKNYMYWSKPYGYPYSGLKTVNNHIDHLRTYPAQAYYQYLPQQVRIALGSEFFADPESGVRMVRFQDPEKQAAFEPIRQDILALVDQDLRKNSLIIN